MLKRLAKLLTKFPMKSIVITVIVVVLLVFGVGNVFMATGNDTLVKSSTDVYKDNLMLEKEFGGESIIVLYESEQLLTPKVLDHMKGLEDALQTSDSIYSVLSPVTLVEEIANKQGDKFQEGIEEIIEGLDTMGTKLIEIGFEMEGKAESNQELKFPEQKDLEIPDLGGIDLPEFKRYNLPESDKPELPKFGTSELPDIEGQLDELNKGFSQLIQAQENLGGGMEELINGYVQFEMQTKHLAENLSNLATQMKENPEQAKQLQEASEELNNLSVQMGQISENTAQLPEVPKQTISGLQTMQEKLSEQLKEQKKQQEQMKEKLQQEQAKKEEQMKQEMEQQIAKKQDELKEKMLAQQNEKEKEMQEFKKEMQSKMDKQATDLGKLAEGLTEMGNNLLSISENMRTIQGYSDIMTPGIPTKQKTLDNIIYEDGKLRSMFKEVIVDDKHMIMMIRFKGDTTDVEKSEVISTINDYLDKEKMDNVEIIVSGKPVLDNAIRSSMQESIQKMMGLALLIMVVVLFIVFKVQWRLMPLLTVLIAVIGTVGLMGWLKIPITMVSMAVFPILIGLGIDYAIQFQNRYAEEMLKEDSDE
nr:MMPL family transporter [Paenibacillus bovis]